MAGLIANFSTAGVALSASTTKTVLQLRAPANQRLMARAFAVSFDGISATDAPVRVRLLKQTTNGTMTTGTAVRRSGGSETVQATVASNATSEPTAGDLVATYTCHPQSNMRIVFAYGDLPILGGERLGIECLASASVNAYATIEWDE